MIHQKNSLGIHCKYYLYRLNVRIIEVQKGIFSENIIFFIELKRIAELSLTYYTQHRY